jgi:hypothetical protein
MCIWFIDRLADRGIRIWCARARGIVGGPNEIRVLFLEFGETLVFDLDEVGVHLA